jgi:hypothetical protein
MPENKRDYPVGNPRGPDRKNLPAPLIEALDEPVTATIEP